VQKINPSESVLSQIKVINTHPNKFIIGFYLQPAGIRSRISNSYQL